ncbi:MAG: DNA primase large subunit PriL [Methanofollis liminatans]|uniref:DNA primase large subunit PriL n=1 Tax=Methanofollis liminatans DSM 4140 TaxID=28892 RepID=J1L2H5_9EURY|nr:DNA primase large subunit PriL [Methanofollis liminatans]EJG06855.1 DNA primase, large subunit [Methanofollis liminatans DSM 4140]MDD3110988.1 DNA primase large subunit PriL [Methanofollis liminatans]
MVDVQDLAKYPFLEEAQDYVRRESGTLDILLKSERGRSLSDAAVTRVLDALSRKNPQECRTYGRDAQEDLFSYVIARMLVSCLNDRLLIERLSQFEAQKAYLSFIEEEKAEKEEIARALGIDIGLNSLPVLTYVPLVSGLHEERWKLVNRSVKGGRVLLLRIEAEELIRERMREIIRERLPLSVPEEVCRQFLPYTEAIAAAVQQQALEEFGAVDESSFPPCISALIMAVTAGTNLPHVGRFALTAFLNNIGLSTTQIVEVFQRAPDFDLSMTMYQVEHISGRSGTEYTAPACATMRTHGLCVRRDAICEKVNHPLTYYKRKKKMRE